MIRGLCIGVLLVDAVIYARFSLVAAAMWLAAALAIYKWGSR